PCFSLYPRSSHFLFLFFIRPPPTAIYTLSLHDALPISQRRGAHAVVARRGGIVAAEQRDLAVAQQQPPVLGPVLVAREQTARPRSEEHTSELQSRENLVCRLLLEKKKNNKIRLK